MHENLADGFYWMSSPQEPRPCLVRVYTNPDSHARGVGFGIWDGSAFLPFSELTPETTLILAVADPYGYE